MEFDNVTFWKRLEEVSGGKSQVQIARDCGIGLNSDGKGCSKISKWKSGDSIPDIRDLMAIAQTYHCSVDYLLGMDLQIKIEPTVKDVCKGIVQLDKAVNFDYSETPIWKDDEPAIDFWVSLSIGYHPKCKNDDMIDPSVYDVNQFLVSYFKIKECNLPDDIKKIAIDGLLQELSDCPLEHDRSTKV